jgi:hypothetical protein
MKSHFRSMRGRDAIRDLRVWTGHKLAEGIADGSTQALVTQGPVVNGRPAEHATRI